MSDIRCLELVLQGVLTVGFAQLEELDQPRTVHDLEVTYLVTYQSYLRLVYNFLVAREYEYDFIVRSWKIGNVVLKLFFLLFWVVQL